MVSSKACRLRELAVECDPPSMLPQNNSPRRRQRPPRSVAEPAHRSCIYVIAGTNGAGKSSTAGSMFVARGAEYFNPDSAAKRIFDSIPEISQAEANSAAWYEGKRLLERAIADRLDFAFETTLGGRTITAVLEKALSNGIEVRVWYVGLETPE